MKCLENNKCIIASTFAGVPVITSEAACIQCQLDKRPKDINNVTLALIHYQNRGTAIGTKAINIMKQQAIDKVINGPGTELKKLIAWFYSPNKRKCKCSSRIQKMNKWGPDICKERLHTILRWLRHSARIARVPYFEPAVKLLVLKAIANARIKLRY